MRKNKSLFFLLLIVALVAINVLASYVHARWDLTEEKRYSLSAPTQQLLSGLTEPVRVDLLMEGEFPANFQRLAESVEEFLQECKEYSNGQFDYRLIDPLKGLDDTTAVRTIDSIQYFFNIPALTLSAPGKVGDEQSQKLVLPGMIINYRDTSVGVNLLEGERSVGTAPEELAQLYTNVEASMEFKIVSALQRLTLTEKPTVLYALGHGEGWGYNVNDMVLTLFQNYAGDTINIRTAPYIPPADALVIAKPTERFDEIEKIKIDQYVAHGGRVFWMIDNMYAEFDSLYKTGGFIAFDRNLNLEDLLFNYGVRINQTLIQDMQCDQLPQVSGNGSEQRRLVDWPFFPILNGSNHPISKNLDPVRTMFPTSTDTVEAEGIRKTPLLFTSSNTRLLEAPARVDFTFLQIAPDERLFQSSNVPIAWLLEGTFTSLYSRRIPQAVRDSFARYNYNIADRATGEGRMIVIADGDVAFNQFSQQSGPLPMGTNVFTRYTFANKQFFTNAMEHLVNPSDILQTRAKQVTLRLLDPRRVEDQKFVYQLINIGLPILLVVLAGFFYQAMRRRRFAR